MRVPDGDPDIRAWLNKVSFKIFNTYENPLRMVEKPPFEVTETGWGGFNIDIRLHFQPISGEKAQYRQHFLQLEKYGDDKMQAEQERSGCVRSEFLEVVQFKTSLLLERNWEDLGAACPMASGALSCQRREAMKFPSVRNKSRHYKISSSKRWRT